MKCMCAQTRPRFILSSERVFGGMEFETMLTPREKSLLPENFPRGGSNLQRCGQQAQTLPMSYSGLVTQFISDGNRKISVMIGTLLYIFGSCERHSKLKEMHIPLRLIPKSSQNKTEN